MIRDRAAASGWALLRAVDILVCTLWLAPLHVVGLADRPSGRQMVSSYVGGASMNGMAWARGPEAAIDWAASLLGDDPKHCRRAFLKYRGLDG